MPSEGPALGEGLVVASEADGRLFKWKHSGEDLGKVPEQLAEAVQKLRSLAGSPEAEKIPPGLLEVFERLLLVGTTTPTLAAAKHSSEAKPKVGKQEDADALAVWTSALTKFDILEAAFAKGAEAKVCLEKELIEQVARDLEKDYGDTEKDARQRAMRVVQKEMGKRFGIWKKGASSGA